MIAQLVMSKGKKPKKVNTKPFDFAFGVYAFIARVYILSPRVYAGEHTPVNHKKRNIGIKTTLGVKITLLRAVFTYI